MKSKAEVLDKNIVTLKMNIGEKEEFKDIVDDYEKFESYTVGKLDTKDNIEKNMILLGLSRKLFTHSIPLIVAQQCYEKLLKDARILVQDTKMAAKREKAYRDLQAHVRSTVGPKGSNTSPLTLGEINSCCCWKNSGTSTASFKSSRSSAAQSCA